MTATDQAQKCEYCRRIWRQEGRLWSSDSIDPPSRFDGAASMRLTALQDHFWARERRALFGRIINRIARGGAGLELGCGSGDLLHILENRFSSVVAVDARADLLAHARDNSSASTLIQADVCASPLPEGHFDFVVALDVIEHVDPDIFLAEARRLTRSGGILLLSAPAFPSLWSRADELAGHRCRYRREVLEAELVRNGWSPQGYTHYQCLLFPLFALSRRWNRNRLNAVERTPPAWLGRVLGNINRIETRLLSQVQLPFGSSLISWSSAK